VCTCRPILVRSTTGKAIAVSLNKREMSELESATMFAFNGRVEEIADWFALDSLVHDAHSASGGRFDAGSMAILLT